MEISNILNQIRDSYLEKFSQEAESIKEDDSFAFSFEIPKKSPTGELVFTGPIRLPTRDDIIILKDDVVERIHKVAPGKEVTFDNRSIVWKEKLAVDISPFHWNGCRVVLSGLSQTSRWQPLKDWYMKWFNGQESDDFFVNATHEIKGPKVRGEIVEFTVDLGSSPVEAFEDFLDTLIVMGYKKVEICDMVD